MFDNLFNWFSNNQETVKIIGVIIGLVGARIWPSLSPKLTWILVRLGGEKKIVKFIQGAEEFITYTDPEKHAFVFKKIRDYADDNGINIKDNDINILVPWILGRLKIKGKL